MLRLIDAYKPLPKNANYKVDYSHVGCFFNYKTYVNMPAVCRNLRNIADADLYNALSAFSKQHYKYRDIMYHNLETVEREELPEEGLLGYYILSGKTNVIAYNSWYHAYHELLHLASTYEDLDEGILYSGFSVSKAKDQTIGEGITEGYVELLCSKDLVNGNIIVDFNEDNSFYNVPSNLYATLVTRQLELLVGEEKLEDMFFKDGFNRLKTFLMQYREEKEVIKFFKNMDAAAIAGEHKLLGLNNRTLQAQEFLKGICEDFFPEKIRQFKDEMIYKKDNLGFELVSVKIDKELIAKREAKNNKR